MRVPGGAIRQLHRWIRATRMFASMPQPTDHGDDAGWPRAGIALALARSHRRQPLIGTFAIAALVIGTLGGCARTRQEPSPPASNTNPATSINARFDAWFAAPGDYERVAQTFGAAHSPNQDNQPEPAPRGNEITSSQGEA